MVTLETAEGQRIQREVQSGGGFMSFDAPRLSFALPGGGAASWLDIRWADGTTNRLSGALQAGQLYQITRAAR